MTVLDVCISSFQWNDDVDQWSNAFTFNSCVFLFQHQMRVCADYLGWRVHGNGSRADGPCRGQVRFECWEGLCRDVEEQQEEEGRGAGNRIELH